MATLNSLKNVTSFNDALSTDLPHGTEEGGKGTLTIDRPAGEGLFEN